MINIDDFIAQQLSVWSQAAGNYAALADVRVREVAMPSGAVIKVQFNPARIVSSGAKVDKASLAARPCFLCEKNRPDVQEGIDWGRYTVLINPFPIFPRHLTIPDRDHTPQRIAGRIADMIALARELPGYTIFYNGPRCGASAPDHMHFQAGNSDFLPITASAVGLPAVILTGSDSDIAAKFEKLYAMLPVPDGEEEPMMNILCWLNPDGAVTLAVIPRKAHRPSFYGTDGDDRMLLSPASVDMGGVFITPLKKDFDKIDAEIIGRIFSELCYSPAEIDNLQQKLSQQ